jgi:hypothetical protein
MLQPVKLVGQLLTAETGSAHDSALPYAGLLS